HGGSGRRGSRGHPTRRIGARQRGHRGGGRGRHQHGVHGFATLPPLAGDPRMVRPRRSVLYMPGSNERALQKATSIPADALILDLEDAVAPDEKAAARERVTAMVRTRPYAGREVVIRVNALET